MFNVKNKAMNYQLFEKLVSEITGEDITLWLSDTPTEKYRSYTRFNGDIQPGTIYGIMIDQRQYSSIDFDFKTTKKVDAFIKSFINKYVSRQVKIRNSFGFGDTTKEIEFKKLAERCDKRVTNACFYTTLYGIGCFALFYSELTLMKLTKPLRDYLETNNIEYSNEFSDAGWVYRFVINKDVEIHNKLLKEFTL